MATTYDPNKDYSKAIEEAKAAGQDTTQLEKERAAKIADKYGGVEPTMYGSDKTYSQASKDNDQNTISNAVRISSNTSSGGNTTSGTNSQYSTNPNYNPSLAGQSVKDGQYTVTYDDRGYIVKKIKDGGASATTTIKTTHANDSIYHQMAYQAAQAGDWDAVGRYINEIAMSGGKDQYGTYDMSAANQYMSELQNEFQYNARDYYNKLYDQAYGAGSSDVFDATGGAIKSYQALVDSVGADKALQFLMEAQQGTPTQTQLPDLEQIYGYGNYGSDAPVYQGSEWDSVLDALAQQLVNMNYTDWTKGDQYQALADRYGQQGKMSMQDVLGQISSRTGGLASSYATTAAQQQYNSFMSKLEDVAMEMYGVEREDLYNRANMARQYAQDDYNKYLDEWNQWNTNRNFDYGVYRDSVEDQRYADELAYEREQDALAQNASGTTKPNLTAAQTLTAIKNGVINDTTMSAYEYYFGEPYGGTTNTTDTGKKTGGSYNNGSLTTAQVKQLQKTLGVTADGLWGENSKKAAGGLSADEAWEKYGNTDNTVTVNDYWLGDGTTVGGKTSFSYDEDEGIFVWNGKTYNSVKELQNALNAADLSDSEEAEIKRKMSLYGFDA